MTPRSCTSAEPGFHVPADDSSDPLRDYLTATEAVPPLRPEDERTLAIASRQGDGVARKKLIEASLRLVVPIARRYEGRGIPLLDLLQEGNLGLVRAIELFDPEADRPFSELAGGYVEEAVSAAVA